jgi:hypothetical protein
MAAVTSARLAPNAPSAINGLFGICAAASASPPSPLLLRVHIAGRYLQACSIQQRQNVHAPAFAVLPAPDNFLSSRGDARHIHTIAPGTDKLLDATDRHRHISGSFRAPRAGRNKREHSTSRRILARSHGARSNRWARPRRHVGQARNRACGATAISA